MHMHMHMQVQSRGEDTAWYIHNGGGRSERVASTTPRQSYPREWPGSLCMGGWLLPRADLEVHGKYRPHRVSIPSPYTSV
jgi:hypothetical protein